LAQLNPPENFYVTPVVTATWDSIQSDDFQFYKLFLDGVFITDVDSVNYQYGSNGEELIAGETYLAEIAALYNDGLSEKVGFEFVYLPCDSFPPHSGFNGYFENNEIHFIWEQVDEELDQIYMGTNFYFENELTDFIPAVDTFYIFPNPGPGFYNYCFRRVYSNDNGIHSWEACEGENCILDAGYPPDLDPPENLEVIDNTLFQNPTICWLEWNKPGWFYPFWLQYDNGINVSELGIEGGFSYAAKWEPEQLTDFKNAQITKVNFFPCLSESSFILKIWNGQNASNLIYEQEYTQINYDEWNQIDLTSPVDINSDLELWIGFEVVSNDNPAGVGYYTGSPNSDFIQIDGENWVHLSDYGFLYSWNLAAYVEAGKDSGTSNDLLGYLVHREGEVITDTIQELSYIDTIPEYNYPACYEVSAVYDMGISDPSNMACATLLPSSSISTKQPVYIYPNPAQTNCKIRSTDQISSIYIYNQMGQQVYAKETISNKEVQVDLTPFENGIYFIEIQSQNKSQLQKLIIQQ